MSTDKTTDKEYTNAQLSEMVLNLQKQVSDIRESDEDVLKGSVDLSDVQKQLNKINSDLVDFRSEIFEVVRKVLDTPAIADNSEHSERLEKVENLLSQLTGIK